MANAEEVVRQSFGRQGLMRHLGAELVRVAPGEVEIRLPAAPSVSQQHGYVHAGAVTSIMDSAGGYAGLTRMPEGAAVLSVEFKVNLLAPADGQEVRAVGRVLRSGRTLTVCQLDAYSVDGGISTHCATGVQTLICLPAKDGARRAG